jgi:hypothetical protein
MRNAMNTLPAGLLGSLVKLAAAGALVTTLAACETYTARRDAISSNAGDAVRSNIALHTDDFWPRQSFDRNVPMRGTRAVNNLRAYDARVVGAPTAVAETSPGATR